MFDSPEGRHYHRHVVEDAKKPAEPTAGTADRGSRRQHRRVDFFQKVRVVVPDEETTVDLFAANVSEGGMFLRSNQPLPQGKKVELEFDVPTGKVRVEDCEVIWSRPFEPINLDGQPAGMGIQFKAMTPDARQTIESFIEDALDNEPASTPGQSMKPPLQPPEGPPLDSLPPREAASRAVAINPNPAGPAPGLRAATPDPQPASVPLAPPEDLGAVSTEPPTSAAGSPPKAESSWPDFPLDAVPLQPVGSGPGSGPGPGPGSVPDSDPLDLSAPPAPRTRLLLFVGFVAVVAVATFLTLFLIKPFDDPEQPDGSAPVAVPPPPVSPEPAKPEVPKPEVPKPEASKPEVPKPEAPRPEAPKPEVLKPEVPRPEVPRPEVPKPEVPRPEVLKPEVPEPEVPEPEAPKPAPDPGAPAAGSAMVSLPVFTQAGAGWRMEIAATGPVQWKTFTLKEPARLAIDVQGADFQGKRLALDNPAPGVSRVRVGKQPTFLRYVLDFPGSLPRYEIQKGPQKLVILFPAP
jgi:uncharacterized protein (TIGR02266 family)